MLESYGNFCRSNCHRKPNSKFHILLLLLLTATLALVIKSDCEQYLLEYIDTGFSAPYSADIFLHPDKYPNNYPSGSELIAKTAVILPYILMNKLEIRWEHQTHAMIATEYLALFICIFGLFSLIKKYTFLHSKLEISIASTIFLVIISTTNIRSQNLGFWAMPFFNGQNYNMADALRFWGLFGIAINSLRKKYVIALCLSIAFHPTLGLLASILACLLLLYNLDYRNSIRLASVTFSFFIGWFLFFIYDPELTRIPSKSWFDIAQNLNYHFFPLYQKGFKSYTYHFCLFLITIILGLHSCRKVFGQKQLGPQVLIFITTILSIFGLAYTTVQNHFSPTLSKVALHRISDIAIFISTFSIFVCSISKRSEKISLYGLILLVVLLQFGPAILVPIIIIVILTKITSCRTYHRSIITLSITTMVAFGAYNKLFLSKAEQTAHHKELIYIASWLKNNTNPGDMFLALPWRRLGLRAMAERPSFGNSREWTHDGFLYSGNENVHLEGKRRLNIIIDKKIDLEKFKGVMRRRQKIRSITRNSFRKMDSKTIYKLQKENVKYIITETNHTSDSIAKYRLKSKGQLYSIYEI